MRRTKDDTVRHFSKTLVLIGLGVMFAGEAGRADPPLDPLPAPHFSLDLSSPAVVGGNVSASDLLGLGYPAPATTLDGLTLGLLASTDDINALSGSNASILATQEFAILFSVDRLSVGAASPLPEMVSQDVPYNALDQASRGHAAGDQFYSTDTFTPIGPVTSPGNEKSRNNVLVRNNFDEGGTDFASYPVVHADSVVANGTVQDRVNATAMLARNGQTGQVTTAYFSLTAGSLSLAPLSAGIPPSGANIFHYVSAPPPLEGACCRGDGSCTITSDAACWNQGGAWFGPGSTCAECNAASPDGACCFGDGSCQLLDDVNCFGSGGIWLGPGTTCEMCGPASSTGACCYGDGTCVVQNDVDCFSTGGFWIGPGSTCDACGGPPFVGACCLDDGTCMEVSDMLCFANNGWWIGPFSTCDLCGQSAPNGACCQMDGTCSQTTDVQCLDAGGAWLGPMTDCGLCGFPPPGACCFQDDTCQSTDLIDCFNQGGFWLGPDAPCTLCQGPGFVPGACCFTDGSCVDAVGQDCSFWEGQHFPGIPCAGDVSGNGIDDTCDAGSISAGIGLYAAFFELGLDPADDIDAMIVFDGDGNGSFDASDRVLLSLGPGSPSLATIPGAGASAAADIFLVEFGQPIALYASAADLGLGHALDNIDALDFDLQAGEMAGDVARLAPQGSNAAQHGIRAKRIVPIPAASEWGLLVFSLLLLSAGSVIARRPGQRADQRNQA